MALRALPVAYRNAVVAGDARELTKRINKNSIELCLTDPVYERLEDYVWLAKECARVLVPGGSLIVQCGNLRRWDCESVLRLSRLTYVDLCAEVYQVTLSPLWNTRVQVGWKPHLWFSKGDWKAFGECEEPWLMNRVVIPKKGKSDVKNVHPWGDSEMFASGTIEKLCGPQSVVWDPFTGGGTVPAAAKHLGIGFVAFEIDADTAEKAKHRVAGTSPIRRFVQRALEMEEAAS